MISYWPNILSDLWRFDTNADQQILREEFKKWSIDFIPKETLVKLNLLISILSYLEKGLPCFIKLLNSGIEEKG